MRQRHERISDAQKTTWYDLREIHSYKDGICFIFLALFLPLIGHVARYTPSSSEKIAQKYKAQIIPIYFFTVTKKLTICFSDILFVFL